MQEGGAAGTGGSGGGAPTSSCTAVEGLDVGGECGSFVDVLATGTMDGSTDRPFSSVTAAIAARPQAKAIFVCGRDLNLNEAIDLPPGYSLHGDVDCASGEFVWSEAKRARVLAPVGEVALRVVGVGQTEIVGFDFVSESAVTPSASSIAAILEGGAITLRKSSFSAGNGAPGVVGQNGVKGADGGPGVGSVGGTSTCGAVGGNGGSGSAPGLAGQPSPRGGAGGSPYTNPSFTCTNGGHGQPGSAGAAGASATGIGMIGLDGFTGFSGLAGAFGFAGGGGGGAGGAGASGFSGTGGGAGGCGGSPGLGGWSGGGSFGIISLNATLVFADVTITVSSGGAGGIGGVGGAGGSGNLSAPPVAVDPHLCRGGNGAVGGTGGGGGGGAGGHAIGLAFQGAVPNTLGLTISPISPVQAGAGAAGAASGVAAPAQAF